MNGPARSLRSTLRQKQSSASKECATSRTTTRGRASKTSIRLFCNPRWNRPGQYPPTPESKCEGGCHFHSCFEQPLYKSGPGCKNARQILKAKVFPYLWSESYFAPGFYPLCRGASDWARARLLLIKSVAGFPARQIIAPHWR